MPLAKPALNWSNAAGKRQVCCRHGVHTARVSLALLRPGRRKPSRLPMTDELWRDGGHAALRPAGVVSGDVDAQKEPVKKTCRYEVFSC